MRRALFSFVFFTVVSSCVLRTVADLPADGGEPEIPSGVSGQSLRYLPALGDIQYAGYRRMDHDEQEP